MLGEDSKGPVRRDVEPAVNSFVLNRVYRLAPDGLRAARVPHARIARHKDRPKVLR